MTSCRVLITLQHITRLMSQKQNRHNLNRDSTPFQAFMASVVVFYVKLLSLKIIIIIVIIIITLQTNFYVGAQLLRFRSCYQKSKGLIITLTLQILFGLFRPSSTSKNRPVYNWGHWLLGVSCHILASKSLAVHGHVSSPLSASLPSSSVP